MTTYLTLSDLLAIIDQRGWGPVRDIGLLESAAHRPATVIFGKDAYPNLDLKAAALLESVVRNHPLIDGNKRLGWLSCAVFYRLNDHVLRADQDQAYDFVIATATGRIDIRTIAGQLARWKVPGSR